MAEAALKHPEPMTVREFLVYDPETPGVTYELVDGSLRAMAPASQIHGTIQGNLARLIGTHLLSSPCRLVTEGGMVPLLKSAVNVRIPDLTVTCEPARPDGDPLVREPKLIGQILSPSNKRDTWETIFACATIPSLIEVVVVDSTCVDVLVFTRDENGHWPRDGRHATSGDIVLRSIDLTLSLDDIYAKTGLS